MQLQARIVSDKEFDEATKNVANTSSKKHESSLASKSEAGPSNVRRQPSEREVVEETVIPAETAVSCSRMSEWLRLLICD